MSRYEIHSRILLILILGAISAIHLACGRGRVASPMAAAPAEAEPVVAMKEYGRPSAAGLPAGGMPQAQSSCDEPMPAHEVASSAGRKGTSAPRTGQERSNKVLASPPPDRPLLAGNEVLTATAERQMDRQLRDLASGCRWHESSRPQRSRQSFPHVGAVIWVGFLLASLFFRKPKPSRPRPRVAVKPFDPSCPRCHHDPPSQASYCPQCGQRLRK